MRAALTRSLDRLRGSRGVWISRSRRTAFPECRAAWLGGALVAAGATAVLVHAGARKFVGYDDFWHVFIARQETWVSFWREVRDNAHPPVFYLLLKAAVSALGNTVLSYRAVSIAAIAGATLALTRVAFRISGSAAFAVLAAATFAFSTGTLEVGLDVRAYATFLLLLLAAFSGYVDWLGARSPSERTRGRVLFATATSLALLTHYAAYLFLGAALAAPAILALLHRRWRVRLLREWREHRLAAAASLSTPLAVAAGLYVVHVGAWGKRGLGHVREFMLEPSAETHARFVVRATGRLAKLFLPDLEPFGTTLPFLALAGLLALAYVSLWRSRGHLAALPFVVLCLMAGANITAALSGRYPYGGELRHEIYLLPFLLLCVFAGLERARRAASSRLSSRVLWTGAVGILVAAGTARAVARWHPLEGPVGQAQMARFRDGLGSPPAILVDQFNFISLFSQLHEWRWHLRHEAPDQRMWQVWELSRDVPGRAAERLDVCREREWQLDLSSPAAYEDIAACLSRTTSPRVGVFRPQQPNWPVKWRREDTAALAMELGAGAGLVPEKVIVDGEDVYASFRFRKELESYPGRISILEASYGRSCGAPPGNATRLLRQRCDGQPVCLFRVDVYVIGDPAPACPKDFTARWTCEGEAGERSLTLPAEAGFGSPALLGCGPR